MKFADEKSQGPHTAIIEEELFRKIKEKLS